MPGSRARPRPTTSWTRYLFGRQSNRSPRMMPSPRAIPDCRGPTSTTPGRSRCCRRCAPRLAGRRRRAAGARVRCRDDQRGVAGSRRRARPARGHTVRARRAGRGRGGDHHPPRRSRRRRRPGARVLLRRSRGGRRRRPGGTRIVCAVVDGVLTARRAGVRPPRAGRCRILAAVGRAFGRRCARRHRTGIGDATSTIRADLSSSCWNPHGNTGFPIMRRHAHCGCWRTPRTSTRSSRSAPGSAEPTRRPFHCAHRRRPGTAGTQSLGSSIASDALRPLTAVVRSARMAAVNAILHSAWTD